MYPQGDRGLVYPDLANSLDFEIAGRERSDALVVGINPMPVYDARYWAEHNSDKYESYVHGLAELVELLAQDGKKVFLFNTQVRDNLTIEDLRAALADRNGEDFLEAFDIQSHKVEGVDELMRVIQSADIVIPTRFHGTVLPLLANKGVLGICYQQKAADLLEDMEQGDYFQMIDDFDPKALFEKYKSLETNLDEERKKILLHSRRYQRLLSEQYDLLGDLI